MAQHNQKNRYALAVGHIAIAWNYLERDLQQIGHLYLTTDADVAAHAFAYMGNVSRVDFIRYLVDRFEDCQSTKAHLERFFRIYHTLRRNRNIVEHSIPAVSVSGDYLDEIIKIDHHGDALPFAASQAQLDQFLTDLEAAREYGRAIKAFAGPNTEKGTAPQDLPEASLPERMQPLPYRKSEP